MAWGQEKGADFHISALRACQYEIFDFVPCSLPLKTLILLTFSCFLIRRRGMEHPNPIAWLNIALKNVIKNMVRDDQKWAKCLLRVPAEQVQPAPGADLELEGIIPSEDMDILKRLYLYGETYEEICEDLGLKKSALAMRVKRSKELFRKNYGEIEKNISSKCEQGTETRHEYSRGGSKP